MDRHSIISLPHASLRQKSQRIRLPSPEIVQLAKDMQAATLDWEDHRQHEFGVALAAVQVDRLERLVVIRNNFQDKSDRTFIVLVNPSIIRREGKIITDSEGCLSVPNLYGMVPRAERVKIKAQDLNGREFRLKADGFLARVLQHEIDHTQGKLFIDHIKDQNVFYNIDPEGNLVKESLEAVMARTDLWGDGSEV